MIETLRPPSLPEAVLRAFAAAAYGLSGGWQALEGERDQNHRLTFAGGQAAVIKVCHPGEGDDVLGCQAEALEHIALADPLLPVPRLIRTLDGKRLGRLVHEGVSFPVMALTFLDGEVIGDRLLHGGALLGLGSLLARLGRALRGFVNGAPARRHLVWDVRHVLSLRPEAAALAEDDRKLAEDILGRHADFTEAALMRMRSQIIHGDVHPYNALMGRDGAISGIIDFGDMVHAPLIVDLANAIADFLSPDADVDETIREFVSGYRSITPLEEEEADVLLDLIEVRLLMTPLVDALKIRNGIASQGYFKDFNGRSLPMIRALRARGHDGLRRLIRRAAAFPAGPARHPATAGEAIARRRAVMGEKLYVFYDPPLHIVKGDGVWLEASDGRRYLDCYNNVPHVGHCHPYVAEAIARQTRTLNTNTRYITDQSIEYAERLTALSAEGLTSVVFVNSGSEANDLAWRMAKAITGRNGGLAMEFAYHGVSEAMDAFSPSNSPDHWNAPHIRLLPAPCAYRGILGEGLGLPGERYAALADPLIADLEAKGFGVAAAIIDSAFMTNGILDAPQGYVQGIAARVRKAGGLFIADEVQSGFGRMGSDFWGHRRHGVTPDFITIGKPAGNGYPLGAVITRPDILAHFLRYGPFFSTFGGNNAACAAGIAVLDVIEDEQLMTNALSAGTALRGAIQALMDRHTVIGDVRGAGLATGVDLVLNRRTKDPATRETALLLNLLRDEGVLMGGEGKGGNVLKIRPPIVFTPEHAGLAAAALDRALTKLAAGGRAGLA